MTALNAGDRLALHELTARYAYMIDTRDWPGLAEIFTDDAVFTIDVSRQHLRGVAAIIHYMGEVARHPVAHHITNVFIDESSDEGIVVQSRLLGVGENGRVSTGHYRDVVVKTAAGWRVARRSFTLTRARPE